MKSCELSKNTCYNGYVSSNKGLQMKKFIACAFLCFTCANLFAQNRLHLTCEISTRESYLLKQRHSKDETIDVSIVEAEQVRISSIGGYLNFVFHDSSPVDIDNNWVMSKVMHLSTNDKFHIIKYENSDSSKNRYQESIEINRYSGKFNYSKLLSGEMIISEGNCKRGEKKF